MVRSSLHRDWFEVEGFSVLLRMKELSQQGHRQHQSGDAAEDCADDEVRAEDRKRCHMGTSVIEKSQETIVCTDNGSDGNDGMMAMMCIAISERCH